MKPKKPGKLRRVWIRFWMRWAGQSLGGRIATALATWLAPPFYRRAYLARLNEKGYVSPSATIHHAELRRGKRTFIGDRVLIFQDTKGGEVVLEDRARLYDYTFIQTGDGGSVRIGAHTTVQPRCQFSAYKASINIGSKVAIAPNCAFYPYDHGMKAGTDITRQSLQTRGDIVIEDSVWIGVGVIVLSGVHIGRGAIIGAGSVVTRSIPEGAIAVGVPARVLRPRNGSRSREGKHSGSNYQLPPVYVSDPSVET